MSRTRIKICGICRPQDAATAAAAGADAVGMVFYPRSKRCVSLELASDILAAVPPFVTTNGLFFDSDRKLIDQTMSKVSLSTLQLHGNETPQFVADLKPIRVIKTLRVRNEQDLILWANAISNLNLTNLIGVLLETPAAETGGSGIPNDWQTLSTLNAGGHFTRLPPFIAAGGLTAATVGEVIRRLKPYAVDLASGVENSGVPREKSAEKIEAFVRAVRAADMP